MDRSFVVECPSCGQYIEILSINCTIFRCGIFKDSGLQINPHTPKEECNRLFKEGLIYGCGKPFKVIDKKTPPEICDYI